MVVMERTGRVNVPAERRSKLSGGCTTIVGERGAATPPASPSLERLRFVFLPPPSTYSATATAITANTPPTPTPTPIAAYLMGAGAVTGTGADTSGASTVERGEEDGAGMEDAE